MNIDTRQDFPIVIPVTEAINQAEFNYIKELLFNQEAGLSINNKGEVSIRQRGQIRPIAKISFNSGILCYHQPEQYKHLLKAWDAWTIDKVIFEALPDNSYLFYYVEDGCFFYTKKQILQLREKQQNGLILPNEKKYEERFFIGHNLRIILPISYSKFYSNILFKGVFPNEQN